MDELEFHLDSLEKLKYSELQKLAKKFGIKANLKSDKIIHTLRELAEKPSNKVCGEDGTASTEEGSKESQGEAVGDSENESKSKKTRKTRKTRKVTRKGQTFSKQNSDDDTETQNNKHASTMNVEKSMTTMRQSVGTIMSQVMSPTLERSTKKRYSSMSMERSALVKSDKKGHLTPEKITTPLGKSPLMKSDMKKHFTPGRFATPVSPLVKADEKKQSMQRKNETPSEKSPSMETGLTSKESTPVKRRTLARHSSGRRQNTDSARHSQNMDITATPCSGEKRPSTGPKEAMIKKKSDIVQNEPNGARNHCRRDTYTMEKPSPGMEDLISAMKNDMTNEQQKEALMVKLNEKVKTTRTTNQSSKSLIPRLTGPIQTANDKKKTPAKDWTKIHQRHWDKLDSIEEYLAKKRKRTESLTQSVKKLRMMTEERKVMKPPTSVSQIKEDSAVKQALPKTTNTEKPGKTKTALFQTPLDKTFKPVETSMSKADFVFGKTYSKRSYTCTPKQQLRRSPRINSANKPNDKPFVFTGASKGIFSSTKKELLLPSASKENKGTHTINSSVKKMTTLKDSKATPLKQSLNNSLPVNSTKIFNIAESLAKPITWKPHKGKLKPLELSYLYVHKTDVKEVKVKSREDRRKEQAKQRINKRNELLAKRRNIDV